MHQAWRNIGRYRRLGGYGRSIGLDLNMETVMSMAVFDLLEQLSCNEDGQKKNSTQGRHYFLTFSVAKMSGIDH